jgi:hypothetical protein
MVKSFFRLSRSASLGEPEEITLCMVLLVSGDSGFGSTLSANGGQIMV